MDEDFVPYGFAVRLKDKGYPQRCGGKYDMIGACYFNDGRFYKDGCIAPVEDCFTAPRIDQVLKWLREEKKIHVTTGVTPKSAWRYIIMFCDERGLQEPTITEKNHLDYSDAIIAGIEYVLDNLI